MVHFAIIGRTPPASVGRLLSDPYVPLAERAAGRYGERFLRAIDRALRVRPEERPQSVGELRADLGFDAGDSHGDAGPDPARHRRGSGEAGGFEGRQGDVGSAVDARAAREAGQRAAAGVHSMTAGTLGEPGPPEAASAGVGGGSPRMPPQHAGVAPQSGASALPRAVTVARPRSRLWLPLGAAVLAAGGGAAYIALTKSGAPVPSPVALAPAPLSPSAAASAQGPVLEPAAVPVPVPPASSEPPAGVPAARPPVSSTGLSGFDQVLRAQAADFHVDAAPTRPRLRIGRDKLSFRVTSERDGHLSVLLHGPDGSLVLLFPNSVAKADRIRAGQTLTLPAASWPLEATAPAGREDFLVIVSAQPRDFSSVGQGRDGWFLKLPPPDRQAAPAGDAPLPAWAGRVDCKSPGCDVYGAAHFTVDVVR